MWVGRGECDDPRERITPSLAEAVRTGKDVVRLAELQQSKVFIGKICYLGSPQLNSKYMSRKMHQLV